MDKKSKTKKHLKFMPANVVLYGLLILFMVLPMAGCVPRSKNIDKADVNATFEKDYEDLLEVAEYLISLENESVWITGPNEPMKLGLDGERDIDPEIKNEIRSIFRRGYIDITKRGSSVVFARWERPFSPAFRSGIAYNFRGTDWVDVDYRIYQQELSVENWYYYEEDYNEYRATH